MTIRTPLTPELLRGHEYLKTTSRGLRPHRLPVWVGARFPDPQLLSVEAQPSGVRVAVVTDAESIELVTHPTRLAYRGIHRPRGSIDLVVDHRLVASDRLTGGDAIETDLQTGVTELVPGPPHLTRFTGLGAGEKLVELWLPHNEQVDLVELRTDAPVTPAPTDRRRWLHHGSSISHGSNATSPARTWPALAARLGGVDLRNLGVGGSALVDPFMARVMRDTPADLISLKLGINVTNSDSMRLRAFIPAVHGFLDTIRDGHPTTPLLLVSPIYCGIHEDTPGPGAFDPDTFHTGEVRFIATGETGGTAQGRLTLRVIRDALASIVEARDDENLHHLDGTALYGSADADEHPLPDALHPDTATHELIGTRFARHAFGDGGPFDHGGHTRGESCTHGL
ncbi:GDSL-type esterase/lipase family protein [Dietzia sp. SL131]|uniref:GDSL-type esterase/lipase family protein n=1 Tax=Dietzia sp. SL131 TaxID=2995149 RepID=UPI00227AB40A|nr:GDSL-type esterase/lipase family protein [Dietzia sp. SL131]MCY1657939.1 GDSL-type esterase/lipase family protein [Dietzia sp. SL131]